MEKVTIGIIHQDGWITFSDRSQCDQKYSDRNDVIYLSANRPSRGNMATISFRGQSCSIPAGGIRGHTEASSEQVAALPVWGQIAYAYWTGENLNSLLTFAGEKGYDLSVERHRKQERIEAPPPGLKKAERTEYCNRDRYMTALYYGENGEVYEKMTRSDSVFWYRLGDVIPGR